MEEERKDMEKDRDWGACCGWGHRRHQDKLDAVGWAAALIWAAFVILMEITGLASDIVWWNAWPMFFIGFGAIVLVGALARLAISERRRSVLGSMVLALVLLGIGLGSLFGWGWAWILPAALIIIAISVLVRAFTPRP